MGHSSWTVSTPCAQPGRCSGSFFSARMSYLETSPELAATLQKAQTAWVQFRNCAYLRPIARPTTRMMLFKCVLGYDLSKSAFALVCCREALLLSDSQEIEQG